MDFTQEDFEVWLEDNKDEAVYRIESSPMPLAMWIKAFAKSLQNLRAEDLKDDEVDD